MSNCGEAKGSSLPTLDDEEEEEEEEEESAEVDKIALRRWQLFS